MKKHAAGRVSIGFLLLKASRNELKTWRNSRASSTVSCDPMSKGMLLFRGTAVKRAGQAERDGRVLIMRLTRCESRIHQWQRGFYEDSQHVECAQRSVPSTAIETSRRMEMAVCAPNSDRPLAGRQAGALSTQKSIRLACLRLVGGRRCDP